MTRHNRIPATIAAGLALALGLGLMAGTGQFRAGDLAHASRAALEQRIGAGHADAAVWSAYGDALYAEHQFPKAADAYQHAENAALAQGVAPDKYRFNAALSLAQSGRPDDFFAYFGSLAATYPKLAVDLLERQELSAVKPDPRFDGAAAAARAQAVD